jgi:hypothetical protein
VGLTPTEFGATTLGLSFVYVFGSFLNGQLLKKYMMDQLIKWGVGLMWLAAAQLFYYALFLKLSYWALVGFVATMYIASSLLFANSSASAFSTIGKQVGSSSALYSSLQVLTGALITALISLFDPTSLLPLAMIVSMLALGLNYLIKL